MGISVGNHVGEYVGPSTSSTTSDALKSLSNEIKDVLVALPCLSYGLVTGEEVGLDVGYLVVLSLVWSSFWLFPLFSLGSALDDFGFLSLPDMPDAAPF